MAQANVNSNTRNLRRWAKIVIPSIFAIIATAAPAIFENITKNEQTVFFSTVRTMADVPLESGHMRSNVISVIFNNFSKDEIRNGTVRIYLSNTYDSASVASDRSSSASITDMGNGVFDVKLDYISPDGNFVVVARNFNEKLPDLTGMPIPLSDNLNLVGIDRQAYIDYFSPNIYTYIMSFIFNLLLFLAIYYFFFRSKFMRESNA
jgi:hypothetical protein